MWCDGQCVAVFFSLISCSLRFFSKLSLLNQAIHHRSSFIVHRSFILYTLHLHLSQSFSIYLLSTSHTLFPPYPNPDTSHFRSISMGVYGWCGLSYTQGCMSIRLCNGVIGKQAGNGVLVHECSGLRFRKSGGERKFAWLIGILFRLLWTGGFDACLWATWGVRWFFWNERTKRALEVICFLF